MKVFRVMIVGAVLLLAAASPAAAAEGDRQPEEQDLLGVHCTAEMQPAGVVEQAVAATRCFNTFSESFEAATGLRLKRSVHPVQLTEDAMAEVMAGQSDLLVGTASTSAFMGQTVVGVDWTSTTWQGSSFTRTVSNSNGCRFGATFSLVYPSGWQDVISSVRNYQYCGTRYYEQTNYAGSTYTCHAFNNCGSLGAMDNEARSVRASDY